MHLRTRELVFAGASLTACGGGGDDTGPDNALVDDAERADGLFECGVASGDPLAGSVIL